MPAMPLAIETAVPSDRAPIRDLHRSAFCDDHTGALTSQLYADGDVAISLVARLGRSLAGHAMLSRIEAPMRALVLAPVAVHPAYQRQGIGHALVESSLLWACRANWEAIFVLGQPGYYERFGFRARFARGFSAPYRGPNFMAVMFHERVQLTGQLHFPAAFSDDIHMHRQSRDPAAPIDP